MAELQFRNREHWVNEVEYCYFPTARLARISSALETPR